MSESFDVRTVAEMQNRDKIVGPRVEVTGFIDYKAKQDDGDYHIRLVADPASAGSSEFVICETIPELPMPNGMPVLHTTVTIRGIARWDTEHGWPEIHPVLSWNN